ncbi:YolA family protein [bacterium]|nr:YolA family protein [bacterium]
MSVQDHGGKWMYIVTREIGYGYLRYATMNGNALRLIKTVAIHLDGDRIVMDIYDMPR